MKKPVQKKTNLIKAVGLLLLVITVLLFVWQALKLLDRQQFAEANKQQASVGRGLAERLGGEATSVLERNICFNTGQGPYDNGKLWCQVSTVIRLNSDAKIQDAGKLLIEEARSRQLVAKSSNNYGVESYWFELGGGMSCRLSSIAQSGDESNGATHKILEKKDAPALAISCARPSKARHYPYID